MFDVSFPGVWEYQFLERKVESIGYNEPLLLGVNHGLFLVRLSAKLKNIGEITISWTDFEDYFLTAISGI